jgi:hypothetical protein
MSIQNANAVAITGGTAALTGVSSVTVNSASPALTVTQIGTGASFLVEDSASPDNTPFIIDAGGFVGIGTSSPDQLLSTNSANTGVNSLVSYKQGGTTYGYTGLGADNKMRIQGAATALGIETTTAQPITFNTNGSEKVRIDASGNVGIGNTAPVTKLHVTGASMTTDVVYKAQPAQTSKAAAATLTIVELLTGIIQYTGAVATLTLPTGTSIEGGLPATFPVDMSFDVSFINTGAALLTIGANGNTTIGTMTVATATSAMLRFRKTATNTYTVYRIS